MLSSHRCGRIVELSVEAVQRSNTYLAIGQFSRSWRALDSLVAEHLDTQRRLNALSEAERTYCRMRVEKFTRVEMADAMGVSLRQVGRIANNVSEVVDWKMAA